MSSIDYNRNSCSKDLSVNPPKPQISGSFAQYFAVLPQVLNLLFGADGYFAPYLNRFHYGFLRSILCTRFPSNYVTILFKYCSPIVACFWSISNGLCKNWLRIFTPSDGGSKVSDNDSYGEKEKVEEITLMNDKKNNPP